MLLSATWPRALQVLPVSRLPLIFDLDETLIVAKSSSQLMKDIAVLRRMRRPQLKEADAADPARELKQRALDVEEDLMNADLKLLQVVPLVGGPRGWCGWLLLAGCC